MVDAARRFLDEGYKITFLNSNTEQDRPACDRIMSILDSKDVEVLDYDGDLESVFELYKRSACVVATRLHTIILSWLYGLPVVPIVYDIKVENMLNSYGFNSDKYDIKALGSVSGDDIFNSMNRYNFVLPNEIITASNQQFAEIDKELTRLEG